MVEDLCGEVVWQFAQECAVVVLDGVLEVFGPVYTRVLFLLGYSFAVEKEVWARGEVQPRRICEDGLLRHLDGIVRDQEKIRGDGERDRPW